MIRIYITFSSYIILILLGHLCLDIPALEIFPDVMVFILLNFYFIFMVLDLSHDL